MSEFNKKSLQVVINDVFTELLLNSPLNRPYQKCAVVPLNLSGLKITEYKMKYYAPSPATIDRIVARCIVAPNLVLRITWEQQYCTYNWQLKAKEPTGWYSINIELEPTIKFNNNGILNGFNAIKRDFSVDALERYKSDNASVAELVQYITSNNMYKRLDDIIDVREHKASNMLKMIAPYI